MNIKGYEIGREIGQGGMATVYLARQVLLDRQVALKVVDPSLGKEQGFLAKFLDEGKIMARLEHPNIARVYDVGFEEGSKTAYMAMEYLPGGSLKERLAHGKLPLPEALTILEQIGAGLGLAHEQSFIHLDIKPGNILFRRDRSAVLTDFGIAKLQDSMGELTRMGYTLGTAQYMSPEQASSTKLDRRSDIYSLGLVFFEMLTGKKAFAAESTAQAIYSHVTQPPPFLPAEYAFLQPVLNRVLAKSPDDRYPTVDAFLVAVRVALSGQPIAKSLSTPDATQVVVLNKPVPKYPPLLITSLFGLALIGIFGGAFYLFHGFFSDDTSLVSPTLANTTVVKETLNLVVDASDSMNLKLGGTPKIEMVRNALQTLATEWDDVNTSRGLLVYGRNKSASCQDVEQLIPSGTANKQAFLDRVNTLEAKGKAPLATALTHSIEDLLLDPSTKRSVLLISSSKDNCGGDPCAKAKQLKGDSSAFRVHVIGLGIQDTATQDQLRCIAEVTGGFYQVASDEMALQQVWHGLQSGQITTSSIGLEAVPVTLPPVSLGNSVAPARVSSKPPPKPKTPAKPVTPKPEPPATAIVENKKPDKPPVLPGKELPPVVDKPPATSPVPDVPPPSDNGTNPPTAPTATDKPTDAPSPQEPDKPAESDNKTPTIVKEKPPPSKTKDPDLGTKFQLDRLKTIPNLNFNERVIPVTPKPQEAPPKPQQ
jgi:serine/threonine protein kinase